MAEDPFRRLRMLAMSDEGCIDEVLSMQSDDAEAAGLDGRSFALVRLGALLALDAASSSYQATVASALAAGATTEEVVGVLVAVAPVVGTARVVAAAPEIGIALGYDVEAAFEDLDA